MRLTAAVISILLVAVMGVAAVKDMQIRSHRQVLQATTAADGTTATAAFGRNEANPAGAAGVHTAKGAFNATKAANTTGNATGNATTKGDGWGDGPRGPEYCYESISCRKRKLMQTLAANEAKAAGAESMNGTVDAINATGLAAANVTNGTGNASGVTPAQHGGGYSGPGTHDSWTVADEVHCQLVGCKKRRLLISSAGSTATAAAAQVETPKTANITGNATGERPLGSGGNGDNGPVAPGSPAQNSTHCRLIPCLKRKLMHTAVADIVATVANETKAAGAGVGYVTAAGVNATSAAAMYPAMVGNATSNATDFRSRVQGNGHGDGDGWGRGGTPYGRRTAFGV